MLKVNLAFLEVSKLIFRGIIRLLNPTTARLNNDNYSNLN